MDLVKAIVDHIKLYPITNLFTVYIAYATVERHRINNRNEERWRRELNAIRHPERLSTKDREQLRKDQSNLYP